MLSSFRMSNIILLLELIQQRTKPLIICSDLLSVLFFHCLLPINQWDRNKKVVKYINIKIKNKITLLLMGSLNCRNSMV